LKLKYAAIIATVLVITVGIILISPMFLRHNAQSESKPEMMFSFSVRPDVDSENWCRELALLLNSHNIGASVFINGQTAEEYPKCVSYFSGKVDIGSQTYSNSDLTSITDYSLKLQEVKQGKTAVDNAGKLSSGIFRAPFGAVDEDIYSLLNRSGIQADFSYEQQYNVFEEGRFVKYPVAGYNGYTTSPGLMEELSSAKPIIVFFDNTRPVSEIEHFFSGLNLDRFKILNASELVGFSLTNRGDINGDRRITSN
jgi:hypothetical protein